ncbi:MAG: TMEM175 family protein [Ferruginibacter sp.]
MEKNTARLEAFSDGIFGVAITLLAIEIGIKAYAQPTNENLWEHFKERWPEYFTFVNSFATVLLVWMGHRRIIDQLRTVNHRIILVNGLLLMSVVFYPFPTRTVGTFINTPAANTATALYVIFTACITLSMFLLSLSILRHPRLLLQPEKSIPWFRKMIKGQLVGIACYGMAIATAFYAPLISLGITFLLWILWAFISKDEEE